METKYAASVKIALLNYLFDACANFPWQGFKLAFQCNVKQIGSKITSVQCSFVIIRSPSASSIGCVKI